MPGTADTAVITGMDARSIDGGVAPRLLLPFNRFAAPPQLARERLGDAVQVVCGLGVGGFDRHHLAGGNRGNLNPIICGGMDIASRKPSRFTVPKAMGGKIAEASRSPP